MPACPTCLMPLKTMRQREGLYFLCPICAGRAVTIPQIRRVAGDRFTTTLLREINSNEQFGERPCPFCTRRMRQFQSQLPPLELDACKPCGVVWFDPQEFEAVPEGATESPDSARLRGIEAQAMWQLEQRKERGITEDGPDETWKTIPAVFGCPVESETDALNRRPWLTWSLSLVIAALSIWAFFHLEAAVQAFGFIPAEAWRYGGLTFLTSFFLHGGGMHLVGNLYFLLIFGDNVEDFVGRWRYLLLVFASTVAGDLLHLLLQSASTVPCIGASGGISGVIVFYALQFPRARLSFFVFTYRYFSWIAMPAWFAFMLWMLMQSVTVILQLSGFGNVAATAHIGGAVAGFLFWLAWRKL